MTILKGLVPSKVLVWVWVLVMQTRIPLCGGHAFVLVQLGALKIDTPPWLIHLHLI